MKAWRTTVKLHDLHRAPGSRAEARRVGRGHGSGRGKTAGRGTKGQKSRSGGNLPAWFEGGQTPLHVRVPKLHGFKNRFRTEYLPLNLRLLSEVKAGTLITPDVLVHDGVLDDLRRPVKVLGNGDAPSGVTIHAHAFSRSALEKLGAAGSTAQRISWPDGVPMEDTRPAGRRGTDGARRKRRATQEAQEAQAAEGAEVRPDSEPEGGEPEGETPA
jgi:large subunit ribosomal protein L15